MQKSKINVITVYINEIMFYNFFILNSNLMRYNIISIDNRQINNGLPNLYNKVIKDKINDNAWLFFVHEDFEIKSSLECIHDLDENAIYGTFGVSMEQSGYPIAFGRHTCSNKDGTNAVEAGMPIASIQSVQTIDCQSILIHTSLLRRHNSLRFDENLSFDLYAEDLCLNASCMLNIPIYVFPLDFQHYSHGKITDRYHKGLSYLKTKYPNHALPGTCSFVGGNSAELEKVFKYNIQAAK